MHFMLLVCYICTMIRIVVIQGDIMAIAKPPFTVDKLKIVLSALNYYDFSIHGSLDCLKKYNDLAGFYRENLECNKKRRENVLRLFDYCETDFDRDILQRRYLFYERYSDIAYEIGYCDRAAYRHIKKALERLCENTRNIPEFEY